MNRLAILTVLFAVTQAVVPATGQTSDNTTNNQKHEQNRRTKSQHPPDTTLSRAIPQKNSGNEQQKEGGDGSEDRNQCGINISAPTPVVWHMRDWIAFGGNITLASVGVVGIGIALSSLCVLRRQTNHLILSERAWVMITTVSSGKTLNFRAIPKCVWRIKNRGKTPARLIESGVTCELLSGELPEIPVYQKRILLGQRPIAPEGSLEMATFWGHQTSTGYAPLQPKDVANLTSLTIAVYGYVKYLDVFDNECVSRFCDSYSWDSVNDQPVNFLPLLTETRRAYTEHT